MLNHNALAVEHLSRSFARHFRAYFAKHEAIGPDHIEQLYWLARQLAHEARIVLGEAR